MRTTMALLVIFSLLLCGNAALAEDMIVVGYSQLGAESDWRTANTESMLSALSVENGFTLIFDDARQSQDNQIKAIRSFIQQEVDYIVLSPVTEFGWDSVLEEAWDANIPVIIVDRMIDVADDSLYVTWLGSDFNKEGRTAGAWLAEELEAQGRAEETIHIVTLQGTIGSSAQLGRTNGLGQIAAEHPDWHMLAMETGDFTQAKGYEVMLDFLNRFEDIDVVIAENDNMAFGAIEAIQGAGRTCGVNGEIIIVSFDAVSKAFDFMEQGLINFDVECNPLHGPRVAEIIHQLERGEKVEKMQYMDEASFLPENAAQDRIGRLY